MPANLSPDVKLKADWRLRSGTLQEELIKTVKTQADLDGRTCW
jgi:hypothetical protein